MKHWLAAVFCLFLAMIAPAIAAALVAEPGMLLVARESLPDVRFREAVVLVVQNGPQGSAGLILNRPSRLALAEALPELPRNAGRDASLSYGGPVAPRSFMALVKAGNNPPDPAQKILDNIYLTGAEQLAAWLEQGQPEAVFRVFAGYAGWAPGQLAGEVARGDWLVFPADETFLFAVDAAGQWDSLTPRRQ